jgi:hypothetical protein
MKARGHISPHPNPPLPGLDPGITGEGVAAEPRRVGVCRGFKA